MGLAAVAVGRPPVGVFLIADGGGAVGKDDGRLVGGVGGPGGDERRGGAGGVD